MLCVFTTLQNFAFSLTTSFASSTPDQLADQLKLAVKQLLESVGAELGINTLLRSESPIEGALQTQECHAWKQKKKIALKHCDMVERSCCLGRCDTAGN